MLEGRLTLAVGEGETRLDVEEGQASFRRRADGQSLMVSAGSFSTAGAARELVAKPSPRPPGRGLQLWLDAGRGLSGEAGRISQWSDQSGQGHHATQAKAELRPTVVANRLKGKPALLFSEGTHFQLPRGFEDFTQGMSVHLVVRPKAPADWTPFLEFAQDKERSFAIVHVRPRQFAFWNLAGGSQHMAGAAVITPAEYQCLGMVLTPGGELHVYKGGVLVERKTAPLPAKAARMENYVGRSCVETPYEGEMAEVLFYNRALDDAEREAVDSYLRGKYFE